MLTAYLQTLPAISAILEATMRTTTFQQQRKEQSKELS
jgi:hypothetical protein